LSSHALFGSEKFWVCVCSEVSFVKPTLACHLCICAVSEQWYTKVPPMGLCFHNRPAVHSNCVRVDLPPSARLPPPDSHDLFFHRGLFS
jgi:hypothetical protein